MTSSQQITQLENAGGKDLIKTVASRYGVQPERMLSTLTNTAFRQKGDVPITPEQMVAMLVVADQYKLNPFTKEIYAFPDKSGGIVPIVGIDGWIRLMNEHPEFDGMEFAEAPDFKVPKHGKECPEWMEVSISRKDRSKPIVVREYLDECYKDAIEKNGYVNKGPWQTHTKRMLRWKTMIQGARVAFGFAGIYDQDEAERIVSGDFIDATAMVVDEENVAPDEPQSATDDLKRKVAEVVKPADVPPVQADRVHEQAGDLSPDAKEWVEDYDGAPPPDSAA